MTPVRRSRRPAREQTTEARCVAPVRLTARVSRRFRLSGAARARSSPARAVCSAVRAALGSRPATAGAPGRARWPRSRWLPPSRANRGPNRAAVRVPQAASTNPVGLARVDRVLLAPLTGRVVVRAGEVAQARLGQARLCRASDLVAGPVASEPDLLKESD